MKFQIQRGGRVKLQNIKKPVKDDWGSGLEAMQAALELEKYMNQTLLDLHKTANKHDDFQVSDFSFFSEDHDARRLSHHGFKPQLVMIR